MVVFNSYVRLPEGTFLHSTWFIMFFHDMWSTKVVCIMNIVIITIITIIIIITILILIMIILYIYICVCVCVPDWWFGTFFIFPYIITYWEFHHPNWRTHIFQRGRSTTNQIYVCIYIYVCVCVYALGIRCGVGWMISSSRRDVTGMMLWPNFEKVDES